VLLVQQVLQAHKVQLVLASLSTDSTQTMPHLLPHNLLVNLAMDILLKTEVFGYGMLKTKTG
jgi:hypothetical protein